MQDLESIILFTLVAFASIMIFRSLFDTEKEEEKEKPNSGNPKKYNDRKVYTTQSGYEYIYNKKGQPVYVHRIQAMKMLGRHLEDGEVIHHIDEDPSNNEFSNLEVMTRKQHYRHHRYQLKNVASRYIKRSFRIRWY
jgi:HNH endonuclease